MVPHVAGTASVEISGPGGLLAVLTAGPAAPTVTVLSPNGGEVLGGPTVTVTWDGADLDGDPLSYVVQYSTDAGGTWTTVAFNVVSETVTLSSLNLPFSTSGLFRVWASDGVHSASDVSDAVFTIPNHPPIAFIEEPAADLTVILSETVGLKGYAYDVEMGPLGLGALSWTSSLDGIVGPGDQLSLNSLSLGVHTITFTADAGGSAVIDTVVITVVANPTLAPVAGNQLTAGPLVLDLGNADEPLTRTLYIENENLDAEITWEAVVSDTWAALSALGGTTPAEVVVSFVPGNLAAGYSLTRITLTSAEAPGQEVVVWVQVYREADARLYLPIVSR
jgi:hypothetical protein